MSISATHRPDAAVPRILLVSGTGTGVGKTMVTAALAANGSAAGARVVVIKPAQTGVGPGQPGDVDEVRRLSGVDQCHELARYPDPLAPETAARASGATPPTRAETVRSIRALAQGADLVLVEGAGGLLVRFDAAGTTLADLASDLDAAVLVVADPELGTLNHTGLTLEALESRGLPCAGVVLGRWPAEPDLACRHNLMDLPRLIGGPLAGVLPDAAATLARPAFAAVAHAALAPSLGGVFDASDFTEGHRP